MIACFNVASLWLVLVVWLSFLGIPVFLGMVVYMLLVFLVYLCVFQQLLGSSDSVSEGFLRFVSLCRVLP